MEGGSISCIRSNTDWNMKELDQPIVKTYKMRGDEIPSVKHEDLRDFLMYDTVQIEYSYLWNPNTMHWTCYKANYDMEWMIPKAPTQEIIPDKHPEEVRTNKVLL